MIQAELSFPVVGLYHEAPDGILSIIREVVPKSRLRVCTTWDGLQEILPGLEVLLAFRFRGRPFPRDAILAAPGLRWLQLSSAGIDHMLPYDPAVLIVTNTSGLHADSIVPYVFTGLLHLMWDFPSLQREQREHSWRRRQLPLLRGRMIGVLGAGRIGRRVGVAARAFGMVPIGLRRSGLASEEFERMYGPDGLPELLERSDVLVVCLPLTPDTRGLLGAKALRHLRPSAYLVNVARGGIVDEGALLSLLSEHRLAGAVLDVFEREPLPPSSEFWDLPNVLITPHLAGEFEQWPSAVATFFCTNLRRWIAGAPLENIVDAAGGY